MSSTSKFAPFSLQSNPIRIVLGSASPRRAEILQTMGLKIGEDFEVKVSPFDEDKGDFRSLKFRVTPEEYVMASATNKAVALGKEMRSSDPLTVIIGADTVVDQNGKVLEKPLSTSDAKAMLASLSNERHKVHTGVGER